MKLTKIASRWERQITTADLLNGWVANIPLWLIRDRDEVTLLLPYGALDGSVKTSDIFFALPEGWRPRNMGNYGALGAVHQGSDPVMVSKNFNSLQCKGTGVVSGIVKWLTSEAPPPLFLGSFLLGWGGRGETHTNRASMGVAHFSEWLRNFIRGGAKKRRDDHTPAEIHEAERVRTEPVFEFAGAFARKNPPSVGCVPRELNHGFNAHNHLHHHRLHQCKSRFVSTHRGSDYGGIDLRGTQSLIMGGVS